MAVGGLPHEAWPERHGEDGTGGGAVPSLRTYLNQKVGCDRNGREVRRRPLDAAIRQREGDYARSHRAAGEPLACHVC